MAPLSLCLLEDVTSLGQVSQLHGDKISVGLVIIINYNAHFECQNEQI